MSLKTLEHIRSSSLFRGFSEQELDLLSSFMKPKTFAEGGTVFVENMPGENLFLILKGTIQLSKMLAEGDERTLAILSPEDYFGEMALFDEGVRQITARAVEEAELFFLNRTDFDLLCDRHPTLAIKLVRNLVKTISHRLRENETEFKRMFRWSTEQPPRT